MTRQEPPTMPEHKPVAEMTREEQIEYAKEQRRTIRRDLAELNRPKRERKLRRGQVKPRTAAEWEIFRSGIARGQPGRGGGRSGEGTAGS